MPGAGLLVLAAGSATRMGAVKQLLPFRGRSLLRHTVEEALASGCQPVVVVLGANAERLQAEVQELPVRVVVNDHWDEGMGGSVRAGMAALGEQAEAVVLAVCDQPFFSAALVRELLAAHERSGAPLVVSAYEGVRGVPALFSCALFPELLALEGPQGARRVIQAHAAEAVEVAFPEGALDLDTPEDYARLGAVADGR